MEEASVVEVKVPGSLDGRVRAVDGQLMERGDVVRVLRRVQVRHVALAEGPGVAVAPADDEEHAAEIPEPHGPEAREEVLGGAPVGCVGVHHEAGLGGVVAAAGEVEGGDWREEGGDDKEEEEAEARRGDENPGAPA